MGRIRLGPLVAALLAGDALIVALHLLLSSHPHLGTAFDLDMEGNVPTWWGSLKLTLAAAAAVFCWVAERSTSPPGGRRFTWGWLAVATLMLGMSCDETGQIHEALASWIMSGPAGANLRTAFGASKDSGAMLWGVIFAPFLLTLAVAVFLFYYSRFKASLWLLAGYGVAVALLAGGLVLETHEARLMGAQNFLGADAWGAYRLDVLVEETSELLASTALIVVHTAYALRTFGRHEGASR